MLIVVLLFAVAYLALTIYLANQAQLGGGERGEALKLLLYGGVLLAFFLGLSVLLVAFTEPVDPDVVVPEIGTLEIILSIIITALTTFGAVAVISSERTRLILQQLVGQRGYFDADSWVHMTAVVLSLIVLAAQLLLFFMSGGTQAMAETIDTQGVSLDLVVIQALIQVFVAVLGVGYGVRRTLADVLSRLHLRWPTREDIAWGAMGGFVLFVSVAVISATLFTILVALGIVTEQQLEEQTRAAESLANAFATLPEAFVLSASAGIGEEILFRGALQPVFGNVITSVLFALLHTQSLLSLGLLLLFFVSLGLGWIRTRYSTTAAIIAHFTYNFVQLAIPILLSGTNG